MVHLASGSTLEISVPANTNDGSQADIAGSASIVVNGSGFQSFSGNNTYTGGTVVANGSILGGNGTTPFGTGSVTINAGGILGLGDKAVVSNPIIFNGTAANPGVLSGFGTYAGNLTIGSGAAIAPGTLGFSSLVQASPTGTLTVGTVGSPATLTFASSGFFGFTIQSTASAGGAPGNGWSLLDVNGTLNLTATAGSPFTIAMNSVGADGSLGSLSSFSSSNSYSWTILTATTITNFSASDFTFNTSNFSNSIGSGSFFVSSDGTDLFVNFTPVPEPSTYALMVIGLGLVGLPVVLRRRRSRL